MYLTTNKTAHNIITQTDSYEEVDSITIDELIKDPADLVKLDVEGAEFEIVCGDAFRQAAPRIHTIIGEWHDWAQRNANQIYWALKDNGFRVEMFKLEANFFVGWKV